MLFLPNRVVEKLKKSGFRPNSIKTYSCSIKRIHRDVFKKDKYLKANLAEYDIIKKHIDSIKNIGVRKSLLAAIITIIKTEGFPDKLIKKYNDYFDVIVTLYDDNNIYKQPSKKEIEKRKNIGGMNDIVKKREEYLKIAKKSKNDRDWIKYLIASLYTYLPPLRQDEYIDMYVISLPKDTKEYTTYCNSIGNNFIDMTNNKIVICKSKTKKKFKIRIISLPIELKKAIKMVRTEMEEDSRKLLNGKMFNSQSGFTLFLSRTLGASSSMLRKLYISELLTNMGDRKNMMKEKNIKKRKDIAYIMGHSLKMQEFTYSRLSGI